MAKNPACGCRYDPRTDLCLELCGKHADDMLPIAHDLPEILWTSHPAATLLLSLLRSHGFLTPRLCRTIARRARSRNAPVLTFTEVFLSAAAEHGLTSGLPDPDVVKWYRTMLKKERREAKKKNQS